jgi:hypothetical protein
VDLHCCCRYVWDVDIDEGGRTGFPMMTVGIGRAVLAARVVVVEVECIFDVLLPPLRESEADAAAAAAAGAGATEDLPLPPAPPEETEICT